MKIEGIRKDLNTKTLLANKIKREGRLTIRGIRKGNDLKFLVTKTGFEIEDFDFNVAEFKDAELKRLQNFLHELFEEAECNQE